MKLEQFKQAPENASLLISNGSGEKQMSVMKQHVKREEAFFQVNEQNGVHQTSASNSAESRSVVQQSSSVVNGNFQGMKGSTHSSSSQVASSQTMKSVSSSSSSLMSSLQNGHVESSHAHTESNHSHVESSQIHIESSHIESHSSQIESSHSHIESSHNGVSNGTHSTNGHTNNIASSYFKATYGESAQQRNGKLENRAQSLDMPAVKNGHHVPRSASRERDSRSRSQDPNGGFSYLSLLPDDGSFPHRTQPIGSAQTSRRNSQDASSVIQSSTEYLNKTVKTNLMVRSNPIGLAEPSVKRDGYAVGKDGSFYRSSENLFSNGADRPKFRSGSETPDRDHASWKERRSSYSSTSSLTGVGIRSGGGLVEPGGSRKQSNMFMPFGATGGQTVVNSSYLKKHASQVKLAKQQQEQKKKSASQNELKTVTLKKVQSKEQLNGHDVIKKGIQEMQSLTTAAVTEKKTTTTERVSRQSSHQTKTETKIQQVGSALKAVADVKTQEEPLTMSFTVKRGQRGRSLSRSQKQMSLPDQSVTISLPPSRQNSRQPSMDRENFPRLKKSNRSSSTEIFTGVYDMTIPNPNNAKRKNSATCKEIHTDLVRLKSSEDQEVVADLKLESDATKKTVVNKGESASESAQKAEEEKPQPIPNETIVQGQKFNLANSLRRNAHSSQEDVRRSRHTSQETRNASTSEHKVELIQTTVTSSQVVGSALKGLDAALNALAAEQKKQEKKIEGLTKKKEDVVSVTVSLPASRATSRTASRANSRRGSVSDLSGQPPVGRSRRNSMDLFTADYNVTLSRSNSNMSLYRTSCSHIRVDDKDNSKISLCARCHSHEHKTANCDDYAGMTCPRCLEWDHWEDTCWTNENEMVICSSCNEEGHCAKVHEAANFKQRRMIVDTLGWEPFREWFYETDFRSWWQLNGCVGVPLYKIYKRNSTWKTEMPPMTKEEEQLEKSKFRDDHGVSIVDKYSKTSASSTATADKVLPKSQATTNTSNYELTKDDSLEELMKKYGPPPTRKRVELKDEDYDSGRSTPEHLKNFPGTNLNDDNEETKLPARRLRTFSDTLKLLDDDILAELDVK